jgi:hypothetical protein
MGLNTVLSKGGEEADIKCKYNFLGNRPKILGASQRQVYFRSVGIFQENDAFGNAEDIRERNLH